MQSLQQDEVKTTACIVDRIEVNSAELQSLTTALSLLRNYIVGGNVGFKTGGNKIKADDWNALQLGIEDLQVLEDIHSDESISVVAGRIKRVIATHVAVLGHKNILPSLFSKVKYSTTHSLLKLCSQFELCSTPRVCILH